MGVVQCLLYGTREYPNSSIPPAYSQGRGSFHAQKDGTACAVPSLHFLMRVSLLFVLSTSYYLVLSCLTLPCLALGVAILTAYLRLPFKVAVFVAASHVISVTPNAVAKSLIGKNALSPEISTAEDAGIAEPFT